MVNSIRVAKRGLLRRGRGEYVRRAVAPVAFLSIQGPARLRLLAGYALPLQLYALAILAALLLPEGV
jgi:hypothetical protein